MYIFIYVCRPSCFPNIVYVMSPFLPLLPLFYTLGAPCLFCFCFCSLSVLLRSLLVSSFQQKILVLHSCLCARLYAFLGSTHTHTCTHAYKNSLHHGARGKEGRQSIVVATKQQNKTKKPKKRQRNNNGGIFPI